VGITELFSAMLWEVYDVNHVGTTRLSAGPSIRIGDTVAVTRSELKKLLAFSFRLVQDHDSHESIQLTRACA